MSFQSFSMKRISLVSGAVLIAAAAALVQAQLGRAQEPQTMPGAPPNPGMPGNPGVPGMQEPGTEPDAGIQQLEDREFLRKALEGGMAEVQLGQLAAQKGASEDVRSFGQKMVDDHTKLGNDLAQVAQGVGVTPPSALSKKDKETLAKLRNLSGAQFDDAYIKVMVKDHRNDDDTFKMEAQRAAIPAVKQAAAEGESVIASHLQRIEQMVQAHDLKGGKTSRAGLE